MKALVKSRPARGLDLLDVADPIPSTGEVLVQVCAAGVCGSDVARFSWSRNYEAGAAKDMTKDLPRILGHEFSGVVIGVGPGVSHVSEGDRVAIQNILSCGRCPQCRRGSVNVCDERRTIGVHRDGGYAEMCVVPEANCTVIPDNMGFHLAAALTPYAVANNAVSLAALRPGDSVIVWGLGPIGLGIIMTARLQGADVALGIDVREGRVASAQALDIPTLLIEAGNVDGSIRERLAARSIDAAFEAAGAADSIAATLPVLKKDSPMVLVGNLAQPVEADLMPLVMDQQQLIGSRSYTLEIWDQAARTIVDSGFEATLGDEVPLKESIEKFERAAREGLDRPFTIMPNPT